MESDKAFDEVVVNRMRSIVFAAGMAAAMVVLLSGCGRKADLDPPSMPVDQQNKRDAKTQDAVTDRPFVLDPLL